MEKLLAFNFDLPQPWTENDFMIKSSMEIDENVKL
jgi:hypothetical protein